MAAPRPVRPRAWGLLVATLVLLAMSTFFSFGPLPTRAGGEWVVCPVGLNALRWVSRAPPVPAAGSAQARAVACATLADRVSAPVGLGLDGVAAVVLVIWAWAQRPKEATAQAREAD